ncbi:beta-ketoacyl synthase chain length factor [Paucibacter sp. JuS9]|uniref:beta-ketoacyl synthase chain length factor n=1 Tax=Paucibacter sp. JuS9 TaxID=3228748 RepID=UPI0037583EF5
MTDFRVRRWAAWAPGLQTQEAWNTWLAAPAWPLPAAEAVAPLAEVPAMTRRRIDPLGRAALQVAWWAQGEAPTGPVVFASRWGEILRSVALLRQLQAGEPLSPTAFSLSVHNASSAVYSIARGDTANYAAVSAGPASAAAGVCEAIGLLADGAPQVLVVSVETELPEPYQSFEQHPGPLRAWAALLEPAERGLSLQALAGELPDQPDLLPPDLATLRFLAGEMPQWRQASPTGGWQWSRHG